MQRVRVGLTGLAFVFLLVMLATALLRMTGESAGNATVADVTANATAPAEPLAQLGVAPGNVPVETAAKAPVTARPAVPVATQAPASTH